MPAFVAVRSKALNLIVLHFGAGAKIAKPI
jgi:hypothetical protein